jgi:hypothetical protein
VVCIVLILFLVVWAFGVTMLNVAPTMVLTSVDLPTLGLPANAINPER